MKKNFTTIQKEDFGKFSKTLSRIDTDTDYTYIQSDNTENIKMERLEEAEKRMLLTRKTNIAGKQTFIEKEFSKNYLVVPVLETINTIWNTPIFQDNILNMLEQVKIDNGSGSVELVLQGVNTFAKPVLDISLNRGLGERAKSMFSIRDFNMALTKYGDLKQSFMITNSFNGTKALTLEHKFLRLVCTNGMTVPTGFFGSGEYAKFRHSIGNAEKIRNTMLTFLETITGFAGKVETLKNVRDLTYDEVNKIYVQETVNKYYNTKKETETYLTKEPFKNAADNFYSVFLEISKNFKNHLDFLNAISYFTSAPQGKNRFSSPVIQFAREIENAVNKNFNN